MTIPTTALKRMLATALVALLAGLAVVGLAAASGIHDRAHDGADPASALTQLTEFAPDLLGNVEWLEDGPLQARRMEPATRKSLEAAWSRVWLAQRLAAAGDPSVLEDWFAGPAAAQALGMTGDRPTEMFFGAHTLQVNFYSDDGAVVGLTADPIRVVRQVRAEDGTRTLVTDERYDVVFMLEDGNWRVRHWVRTGVRVVHASA